ncbi:unnamed protein product [Prunus armeniaca]
MDETLSVFIPMERKEALRRPNPRRSHLGVIGFRTPGGSTTINLPRHSTAVNLPRYSKVQKEFTVMKAITLKSFA